MTLLVLDEVWECFYLFFFDPIGSVHDIYHEIRGDQESIHPFQLFLDQPQGDIFSYDGDVFNRVRSRLTVQEMLQSERCLDLILVF